MELNEFVIKEVKPLYDKLDKKGKQLFTAFLIAHYVKQMESIFNILFDKEMKE